MQTQGGFKAYYDRTLLPLLTELDQERKGVVNKFLLFGTLGILSGIVVLITLGSAGFVLIIGMPLILYLWLGGKVDMVKQRFKKEVMGRLITAIDPSLQYESHRFIPQTDYKKSKLFLGSFNRYNGDDLIYGTAGKTAIRFSELLIQMVTSSGKNTQTTTIFRGIFFIADFNKKFAGETFVVPDNAEKFLGSFGTMFQKMAVGRPPLVKLEDVAFEKEFCVYGTDQVEARYILSPALMQRIMEFKNKSNHDISISFIDSNIYIAISLWKNLFEAPLWQSMINYDRMVEYYSYLRLCVGIVEVLDLNTRIWTKE